MDLCIFAVTGNNFTGYYQFLKSFCGLADIPTIFQEKIDQTLENKHSAWLDIIVVANGSKQKHMEELIEVSTKRRIPSQQKQVQIFQNRNRVNRS